MTVETVTGPIRPEQMGRTLMHEHVLVLSVGLREAYPQTFPRDEIVRTCVHRLGALQEAGIDTIVDHSPYDLGRDPELLAEISRRSGVQIICCTGAWVAPQRFFHKRPPREAAELFIRDLREGIAGSRIRAGILKCATESDGLTEPVERVLRACAIAHRTTGAPISTHTHAASQSGTLQQDVFADEGVDLSRVIIGHCGDTENLGYLRQLLARGSFIGLDRFGVEDVLPDGRRMDVVAALCAEGHTEQLLLSHDASCWNDRQSAAEVAKVRPKWHHGHILDEILPGLRTRGVTEAQIETMLVQNPTRIFAAAAGLPDAPHESPTR